MRKFFKCIGLEEEHGTMGQAQINSLKTVRNGAVTFGTGSVKCFKYHLLFIKQKNCWVAREAGLNGTITILLSKLTAAGGDSHPVQQWIAQ